MALLCFLVLNLHFKVPTTNFLLKSCHSPKWRKKIADDDGPLSVQRPPHTLWTKTGTIYKESRSDGKCTSNRSSPFSWPSLVVLLLFHAFFVFVKKLSRLLLRFFRLMLIRIFFFKIFPRLTDSAKSSFQPCTLIFQICILGVDTWICMCLIN